MNKICLCPRCNKTFLRSRVGQIYCRDCSKWKASTANDRLRADQFYLKSVRKQIRSVENYLGLLHEKERIMLEVSERN